MHSPAPAPRNIETPQAAEQIASAWMRHWGFHDAKVTPPGPDGGLDVVARDAVAQVKFYGAPISRPALQQLAGANHKSARQMIFFTTSGYSQPAREYAGQVGMALFVIEPFGKMWPANSAARRVATGEEERRRQQEKELRRQQAKRADEAARMRKYRLQLDGFHAQRDEALKRSLHVRNEGEVVVEREHVRHAAEPRVANPFDAQGMPASGVDRPDSPAAALQRKDEGTAGALFAVVCIIVILTVFSGLLPQAIDELVSDGIAWAPVARTTVGGATALVAGICYLYIATQLSRGAWVFVGMLLGTAAILWWTAVDEGAEAATWVLAVITAIAWLVGILRPR